MWPLLRSLAGVLLFFVAACQNGNSNGNGNLPPVATPSPCASASSQPSGGLAPTNVGGACGSSTNNSPQPIVQAPPSNPPQASSPTGTDLVIANNTGLPNASVFVYAVGGGKYLQANGSLAAIGTVPIPSLPLAPSGDTVVPLPFMNSARIYFSLNTPLRISQGTGPGFGADTPVFDWAEFNYGPNAAGQGVIFINTTQVDMFGLPMTIKVDSGKGSQIVGLPDGSRNTIFSSVKADPTLANLIVSNGGVALRVLAPDHGIDQGLIPASYLDAYINQVWQYYQTHTISLNAGGTWSGQVSNGIFTFTQGGQSVSFSRPTSTQVFGCGIPVVSGNGGAISPALCAGLNRGTLIDGAPQPDYTSSHFYNVTPTNAYAKIMHQYNLNGLAYGFPYDDAGGQSSVLSTTSPTRVTITLSRF